MVLERRLVAQREPVPRALALALLFLAALIAAHLVPGALGVLSAGAVALTAGLGAVAAWRLIPAHRGTVAGPAPAPVAADADATRRIVAAVGLALAAVWLLAALFEVRGEAPSHVDALSFSLPGVAGWIESGSIWHVGEFLPYLQVRTYPNNGDVLALAAILPWRDDAFLRLLAVPLLAMTAAAVYGVARELRAPASTSALLGAGVAATGAAGGSALFDLKPDAFMYATFAGGVLFAVRHARTGLRGDLALAGLGLGLALGSRWYGLTAVAGVAVVWLGALLVGRRGVVQTVRTGAILGASVLAAGGFWLVRNTVLTGNPLYPVDLGPLDAPRDVFTEKFGFTVAERLTEPGFVGDELLPALWGAFDPVGVAVVVGACAALALCAARGACARALVLTVAAGLVALTYAFLPAGAQGFESGPFPGIVEGNMRWLMPAVILAAGPAAWAVGRLPRLGAAADVVLLVCLAVTVQRTFSPEPVNLVVGVAVVALAVAIAVAARAPRLAGPRRLAVALAAVVVVAIAGYLHERRYDRARYVGESAAVDWIHANAPSGQEIGVAGDWAADRFVPIYPLFGPRLENDVEYVGREVDEQVRYHESAGAFIAALEDGGYDVLAVGTLSRPDFEDFEPQRRVADPMEARWAEAAGWVEVARDDEFVLLARPDGA